MPPQQGVSFSSSFAPVPSFAPEPLNALPVVSPWQHLLPATTLPALTPQAPWHGYSLGDWSATWDLYAQRAIAGQWPQNGEETLARRQAGLIPETPVREVEGQKK